MTEAPSLAPREFLIGVTKAISVGAYADARAALVAALSEGLFGEGPSVEAFLAFRLLGEATRKQTDFEAAMGAYQEAQRMASEMRRPDLESAAVEGMGMVAKVGREPIEALKLFDRAQGLAEEAGDVDGVAALLSNKGNLLADTERFAEAEPVLRQALEVGSHLPPKSRGSIEDNLSIALAGLDRHDEAIAMARSAAALFAGAGAGFDRYEALSHLERYQREAGDDEGAVETFVECHELITSLEAENVNVDRYLAYPEVVRQIEDGTALALRGEGRDEAAVALEIGIRATLAEELREGAERDIEGGEFVAAEKALLEALDHWGHLHAFHALPSIHHALSTVYFETGQPAKAREHALQARDMAHRLGDAWREMMACSSLARFILAVPGDFGTADALHQVARALALRPLALGAEDGTLRFEAGSEPPVDGSVLETLDASICIDHGALDLAERATRRALAAIDDSEETADGELMAYRRWSRLLRLFTILRRRDAPGDGQEAAGLRERLVAYLEAEPDLRSSFTIRATLGAEKFADDAWTEETLELLVGACDAYEEMREGARPIGELSAFSEVSYAPFAEAIEVAVHLGDPERALHLLERSKSRSLLETLGADRRGVSAAVEPATAAELAEALAERASRPLLLELFVGPRNVFAFAIDGTGELQVHELGDTRSDEWTELTSLVLRSSLAGDGSALKALSLPATRRLADFVKSIADGRPVYLSPHGLLHSLPLHLVEEEGVFSPLPRVYHLPSGSLLRIGAGSETGEGSLVGGDPGGDLSFAATEAKGVAARFGVTASIGADCSFEWLQEALDPGHRRLRLIHLACHALFRPMRGERSGLALTQGGAPGFVTVPQLASLDWGSELVMLSACSSGQQEVGAGDEPAGIPRALLGRGARALVVSLWEVPDLATYLLVKNLYEDLPVAGELDLQDIGRALADAQTAIRDTSARELIATALELRAAEDGDGQWTRCALLAARQAHASAGGSEQVPICDESLAALAEGREPAPDIGGLDWDIQAELAEDQAYEAKPLRAPVNWAAFVLIGRR